MPPHYVAEARVKIGGRVEIDVGTFDETTGESAAPSRSGAVAVWAPPRPVTVAPLDFGALDVIEVQVSNDEEGPRLVAAVELVSPANKDRPSHRQMFVVKCAGYLQEGIGLAILDVVTQRHANLHGELLELLRIDAIVPARGISDLYATAYRATDSRQERCLEIWAERLELRATLPTLPLWIAPDLAVPLDLEATYLEACVARRIAAPDE